jgi:hypothetical protein
VKKVILFSILVVLLAGCGPLLNFTPQRAAVQEALNFGEPDLPVDPDSIQVLQSQEQGEMTLVLVAFQRGRGPTMPDECLAIYEVRKSALGWQVNSGGTGCGPIGGDGRAIDVTSGSQRSNESASSQTVGLVRDPSIVTVEVTWQDGEIQSVPVINGSYLAWREGVSSHTVVLGLDAGGEVIYASDTGAAAPGKETP